MVSSPILFVCFILPLFPPITFLHGSLWKCTALSFSGASLLKTHTAHKIGIKLICDAPFSLISLPYTASAMNFAIIKDKTFHLLAQKTYWYSVYWFLIIFSSSKCMGPWAYVDSCVPCTCRNPRTPQEVIRFPGNGVVSHVGAEIQTWSRARTESTLSHQINSLVNILIYWCFSKKMPGIFLSHDSILAALNVGNFQFSIYMLFPYFQY